VETRAHFLSKCPAAANVREPHADYANRIGVLQNLATDFKTPLTSTKEFACRTQLNGSFICALSNSLSVRAWRDICRRLLFPLLHAEKEIGEFCHKDRTDVGTTQLKTCFLLAPEATSQGLPSGSFCSCRDCKTARNLGTRTSNRLAICIII